MSSVQKSFAQINVRGKYLIAVDSAVYYTAASADSVQLEAGVVATQTAVAGILKDLGREIVTYTTLGQGATKLAVYRQVQLVSGVASEGVPASDSALYVKVWDAAGAGVGVARLG